VETELGQGSIFWFTVRVQIYPVADVSPAERNAIKTKAQALGAYGLEDQIRARVLLVEDNQVNRTIAVKMLQALGCTVSLACDGRQALEAAKSRQFDLVLMDCQMPVMDGFEATRAIRAHEAESTVDLAAPNAGPRHVPIVALTANAIAGDRERCLASGMDDYLAKPFKREQLRAVLARWLETALG
jgi:CheY-like chemotaxis protein